MPDLIVHKMLPVGNMGDRNNVIAVSKELQATTFHDQECNESNQHKDAIAALQTRLIQDGNHVLVLSGEQGTNLLFYALQNPAIKNAILQKRLTVVWSGHQPSTKFNEVLDHIHVVGMLIEATELDPELKSRIGNKLVPMEFVPSTLNIADLISGQALMDWNQKHPAQQIPESSNGYITAFLPGDAPDRANNFKFYSPAQAYELGVALGNRAHIEQKTLLVTNGPRMGKFYPESDPNNPVLRRFKRLDDGTAKWIEWNELTATDLAQKPAAEIQAHRSGAPMDPVMQAFQAGVKASSLAADKSRIIDFVHGDSAQLAIYCATYRKKHNSSVYYSEESISGLEATFFFNTFVIAVPGLSSDLHEAFFKRIHDEYRIVGSATINGYLLATSQPADGVKQRQIQQHNPQQDAARLAQNVSTQVLIHYQVLTAKAAISTTPRLDAAVLATRKRSTSSNDSEGGVVVNDVNAKMHRGSDLDSGVPPERYPTPHPSVGLKFT